MLYQLEYTNAGLQFHLDRQVTEKKRGEFSIFDKKPKVAPAFVEEILNIPDVVHVFLEGHTVNVINDYMSSWTYITPDIISILLKHLDPDGEAIEQLPRLGYCFEKHGFPPEFVDEIFLAVEKKEIERAVSSVIDVIEVKCMACDNFDCTKLTYRKPRYGPKELYCDYCFDFYNQIPDDGL